MNRRFYLAAVLCALLSFLCAAPTDAASAPQVARLSLVTENVWDIDQATIDELDDMVADALRMPFGGLMGWLHDVDEHDLFAAYDAAFEMKKTPRGAPDYPAILRMTADVTDADLAVLPILEYYDEEIYRSRDFYCDDYLVSRASVRIFRDEDSMNGRAEALACDAMRAVLDKVQLKERVRDLREAARSGR